MVIFKKTSKAQQPKKQQSKVPSFDDHRKQILDWVWRKLPQPARVAVAVVTLVGGFLLSTQSYWMPVFKKVFFKEQKPSSTETASKFEPPKMLIAVVPAEFKKYLAMDSLLADSLLKKDSYTVNFKYPSTLVPHARLKEWYFYPGGRMEIDVNGDALPLNLPIGSIQYDDSVTVRSILQRSVDRLLVKHKAEIQSTVHAYLKSKSKSK